MTQSEIELRRMNSKELAIKATLPTLGRRHFVTLMLFLGMANAYVMRTNMSVAIVAMVHHPSATGNNQSSAAVDHECPNRPAAADHASEGGEFHWSSVQQGYILAAFFYGYVVTQIPFALLTVKYGAIRFLGWGMLCNSVFAFLVPPTAHLYDRCGLWPLLLCRFMQGLGEGPIVPCTHALLAKWIPRTERSRLCSAVYSGAQFGTIISMPASGLLSAWIGWPWVFYGFGLVGLVWSVCFLWLIAENPVLDARIRPAERQFIEGSLWGSESSERPKLPIKAVATSLPFIAILCAHMAQNYGYETLMTELPTYMKSVLHFSLKENGFYSALPYCAMMVCASIFSCSADWMICSRNISVTHTRKIINSIAQMGPAICLVIASYTGCNRYLTVAILTFGLGLNGGIYSGFKVNHIDLSQHYAGILMAFTNCSANIAGMMAPIVAGYIIEGDHSMVQWRIVFCLAAGVYLVMATVYLIFASGVRQPWDRVAVAEAAS